MDFQSLMGGGGGGSAAPVASSASAPLSFGNVSFGPANASPWVMIGVAVAAFLGLVALVFVMKD